MRLLSALLILSALPWPLAAQAQAPTVALACRYSGEGSMRVQFDGTDYYYSDGDGSGMGHLAYQAEGRNSFVILDGPLVSRMHMLGGQYQQDRVRLFTDGGFAWFCAPQE